MNVVWWWLGAAALAGAAAGHGRLVEPPSRASAWRFGFDTPHNYNDHELYCGGFTRQWKRNGGQCGVCGDPWDAPAPRAHELGGRFGKGVIVRRYAPGATFPVRVELTANHNGYFEFRVCDDPAATDQPCLDRRVLRLSGRDETRYFPREGNRVYEMQYRLPEGLECAHCVLQWRYIAGNNWGTCENGTGAVGCGPQEEFRACADIAVGDKYATTTRRPRPTYVPPGQRPALPTPAPAPGGSAWHGALVAALALLLALAALAGIYLYYYRGGMRIKNLLRWNKPPPPPVAPPRARRGPSLPRDIPPLEGADKVAVISDSGFETVDLRAK